MLPGDDSGQDPPVVRRLNALRRLSNAGVVAIKAAMRERVARASEGEDIAREGDRSDTVRVFLSG
jgi:hypothetical protein